MGILSTHRKVHKMNTLCNCSKNEKLMDQLKRGILEAVVDYIKEEGVTNIQTRLDGYENPAKIVWKKSQNGHFPDIFAESKNTIFLFEVPEADGELKQQLDKWRLFTAFSKQKNAQFYVVVKDNQENRVKKFLDENGISASVLMVKA